MGTAGAMAASEEQCDRVEAAGTTASDDCMIDSVADAMATVFPDGAEAADVHDAHAPALDDLVDLPHAGYQDEEDPFGHGGALDQQCEAALPAKRPRAHEDPREVHPEEPPTRRRAGDPGNGARRRWHDDARGSAAGVAGADERQAQGPSGCLEGDSLRRDAPPHGRGSDGGRPRRALSQQGQPEHQGSKRPRLRSRGSSRAGDGVDGGADSSGASSSHQGGAVRAGNMVSRSFKGVGRSMGGGDLANAHPAPAHPRRGRQGAQPCGEADTTSRCPTGGDWTPVWMRRPSWLYLPHLQENQDFDVPRGARANLDGDGAAASARVADGHHTEPPTSPGQAAAQGDSYLHTSAEPRGGDIPRGSSASSSSTAARANAARRDSAACPSAAIDEPYVHAGSGGTSAAAAAAISGRGRSPGPVGVLQVPQHLAISFAQIEERRIKRRMQRGDDPPVASAAERIAAIRWRIANRRAAEPPPARPAEPPD